MGGDKMTDNYEQLRQCYGCNGYRGCDLYVPNTTPLCVWKETLQADMEKLKNGEGCIILIASYLDTLFIGRMEFKEYLFQCFWEYTIFWMGYWMCEKVNKI